MQAKNTPNLHELLIVIHRPTHVLLSVVRREPFAVTPLAQKRSDMSGFNFRTIQADRIGIRTALGDLEADYECLSIYTNS